MSRRDAARAARDGRTYETRLRLALAVRDSDTYADVEGERICEVSIVTSGPEAGEAHADVSQAVLRGLATLGGAK